MQKENSPENVLKGQNYHKKKRKKFHNLRICAKEKKRAADA